MQHLQEMGLKLKETMLYWVVYEVGHENNFVTTKENAMQVIDESCGMLPAYTLQDVLDKLPTEILLHKTRCWLSIDFVEGLVEYYSEDYNEVREHMRVEQFHKDKPLIDAAYAMLSWCIYNKFVETNKNG